MSSVLVVEDSPRRIRALLEAGVIPEDARIVATAAEAVRSILDQPWEKVFLDFDLKGEGDGGDAARALIAAPWRPETVHIHSTNTSGGLEMRAILQRAGLAVQWVPITRMLPGMNLD